MSNYCANEKDPAAQTAESSSETSPSINKGTIVSNSIALIPVFTGTIADRSVQLCCARTLHTFMQVRRDFTTWIKGRIRKFGFIANDDYLLTKSGGQVFTNSGENLGGRPTTDYHLTLDMAKELSMVENNEQGRSARRYFIECERKVLEQQSAPTEERMKKANALASAVAAQAHGAIFEAVMGGGVDWKHDRYLVSFCPVDERPRAKVLERSNLVMSIHEMPEFIRESFTVKTETLKEIIAAATDKLASRLDTCERRLSAPTPMAKSRALHTAKP